MSRAETAPGLARDRLLRRSLAASAALHVSVCLLVWLVPRPPPLPSPPEDSIGVEMVSLQPLHSSAPAKPLPPQVSPPDAAPSMEQPGANEPDVQKPEMVRPSRMLSQQVLSDRRSRNTRQQIATLRPSDRMEQLCGLEAMAQVGAWSGKLRPDRVVAYATADPKLEGTAVSAEGAALHSGREWYRLRFKCRLNADRTEVVAFEFSVGDAIPKQDWAASSLPDEDGALD